MHTAVFLADVACFAGFGWAMVGHFRPAGKPRAGMLFTAATVPVFAALHLWAIFTKPLPGAPLGLILYAAGAGLFWQTIAVTRGLNLAACFQGAVPERIVCTGPYHFIRHPFYVSYLLVWIGGFAATGWWPLAVTAIVMGTVYYRAARQEEHAFLNSQHAAAYSNYMRKIGAFVPRFPGTQ